MCLNRELTFFINKILKKKKVPREAEEGEEEEIIFSQAKNTDQEDVTGQLSRSPCTEDKNYENSNNAT